MPPPTDLCCRVGAIGPAGVCHCLRSLLAFFPHQIYTLFLSGRNQMSDLRLSVYSTRLFEGAVTQTINNYRSKWPPLLQQEYGLLRSQVDSSPPEEGQLSRLTFLDYRFSGFRVARLLKNAEAPSLSRVACSTSHLQEDVEASMLPGTPKG